MKVVALNLSLAQAEQSSRLHRLGLVGAMALALLAMPAEAQTTAPAQGASGQSAPSATPSAPPAPAQTPPSASGASSPPAGQTGQAAQPGIRAVDPTTVRLTFYTVQPADMLVSKLMDLDVHNLQNEEIGEIEDLIVDNGKTIRGVVIGVGGFLGIGERYVAVDPGSLVITREAGGSLKAVVNTTREDLTRAPEFKFEGNMKRGD